MVLPPSKKVYRQNRSFLGCWPKAGFMGAWTVCGGCRQRRATWAQEGPGGWLQQAKDEGHTDRGRADEQ